MVNLAKYKEIIESKEFQEQKQRIKKRVYIANLYLGCSVTKSKEDSTKNGEGG